MNCLDKYRNKLVREINQNLRTIQSTPDEEAMHDFRVGVKRLTAFYFFLNEIKPGLKVKKLLKPYRSLFKLVGCVRDGHIAVQLIQNLKQLEEVERGVLVEAIESGIMADNHRFTQFAQTNAQSPVRMPSVNHLGISERAILKDKSTVLHALINNVIDITDRMSAQKWHKKRILLKRYHHILDAFQFCPGHLADEVELKKIYMLQKLLGDWHDRVVTMELLQSLNLKEDTVAHAISIMQNQDNVLLGSARIYLNEFSIWYQASR